MNTQFNDFSVNNAPILIMNKPGNQATLFRPSLSASFFNRTQHGGLTQQAAHQLDDKEVSHLNMNKAFREGVYTYTYQDIAQANLKYLKEEKALSSSFFQGDPMTFVERYRTTLLSASRTMEAAFKILGRAEGANGKRSIINQRTWDDLNLIGQGDCQSDPCVGSVINHTNTQIGKGYLLGQIARPICDKIKILKRQSIIQSFVKDDQLTEGLHQLLEGMKGGEEQLLTFWSGPMEVPGSIHSQYFKYSDAINRILNRHTFFLEINSALHTFKKLSSAATQAISIVLLPLFALQLTGIVASSQFVRHFAIRLIGNSGPLYALVSLIPSHLIQGITAVVGGVFAAINLEARLKWTKADLEVEALIQQKLVDVAHYYRGMKLLRNQLLKNPSIKSKLEHFKKLDDFFDNKKLSPLFVLLESRTFDRKAQFFFRKGHVLLTLSLLQEDSVKKQFEQALMAVGEIDAFMSMATLYKTHQGKENAYCFPEIIDGDAPVIEMTDFWNPLLIQQNGPLVTNSLHLNHHALITGANGGGKSTSLKSIAIALVLFQSYGIACAKKMRSTLYRNLTSSMNISDDIKGNRSLYQVQVDVVKGLIDVLKRFKKEGEGLSFALLDELFTGTKSDVGEALAYATVERLGKFNNSMSIIATHFDKLTDLERTRGNFRNYHFPLNQTTGKPLYKIRSGKSNVNTALKVAEQRGLDPLTIDRAKKFKRWWAVVNPAKKLSRRVLISKSYRKKSIQFG